MANRSQCSSFRVTVAGLPLGNIMVVKVGKKEVVEPRRDEALSLDIRETVRSHHYKATDIKVKDTT